MPRQLTLRQRLDAVRATADAEERAGAAAALLRELEAASVEARELRDEAVTCLLIPPYGLGTTSLAAGARIIGVTRGFMRPYFHPAKAAERRQRESDAARAAVG